MSIHDSLFPVDIALNSEGGPERRTDIVSLVSGHEQRNSPWAHSRRRYNAGYGVKSIVDIENILAFFEARQGRLYGFRFRDPFDHKSCSVTQTPTATDQNLGSGDGIKTQFDIFKTYSEGTGEYKRRITQPYRQSINVAIDGTQLQQSVDFEVEATGVIRFPTPPVDGAEISVGFIFDTPVRFDTDQLQISLSAFKAGDIPNIPLIEVLL